MSFALAAVLVALLAYLGYVGFEGSSQLIEPPAPTTDCRTPATFGWEYEAINYDPAIDEAVAAEPDPAHCGPRPSPELGDDLTTQDGVRLAGWYVPAAGVPPSGPTLVLVHGYGSNKSNMLDRAAILHDVYNLVLYDARNHGQSAGTVTTHGVREREDLQRVIDWVEQTKAPAQLGVLGMSMGGAIALNEADTDPRVDALIIESTHATLASAAAARLDRAGYPLSLPGSWAILLGGLMRTGLDMSAADPIQAASRLDGRPILFIHGANDDALGRTDPEELLAAATEAGSPASLAICDEAGHAGSFEVCPEEYTGWVLGFLDEALAP